MSAETVSPRSFNEFEAANPNLSREELLTGWNQELRLAREARAADLGVDAETLHMLGLAIIKARRQATEVASIYFVYSRSE